MKNAIYTFLFFLLTLNTVYSQNDLSIKANEIGVLFNEGINNPYIERRKEMVSQVISENLNKNIQKILAFIKVKTPHGASLQRQFQNKNSLTQFRDQA